MIRSVIILGTLAAKRKWSPSDAFAQSPFLLFISGAHTNPANLPGAVESDSGDGLVNYITETRAAGGLNTPTERIHFADERGLAGQPDSGLSAATSGRDLELAFLDVNVQQSGTVQLGQADDTALIADVGTDVELFDFSGFQASRTH